MIRLSAFQNVDWGNYGHFEIEDMSFFGDMIARIAENTSIVICVHAIEKKVTQMEEDLVEEALRLIDSGSPIPFTNTPESAIVFPDLVHSYAKAPLQYQYTEGAIRLLSRFLNFHLIAMLRDAAARADVDKLSMIKLRHILPYCEKWPWPLNEYC